MKGSTSPNKSEKPREKKTNDIASDRILINSRLQNS